jgi:hypothetical protein
MFSSQSSQSPSCSPDFSSRCDSSPSSRSAVASAPQLFPRFVFFSKLFRIRPYEKTPWGWGISDFRPTQALPFFSTGSKHPTHGNARNPFPLMGLLHSSHRTPGVGGNTLQTKSLPCSSSPHNLHTISTCKTLSKQTTLTSFTINAYEKPRGRDAFLPGQLSDRDSSPEKQRAECSLYRHDRRSRRSWSY